MRRRSLTFTDRKSPIDTAATAVAFRGGTLPELSNGLQRVGHTLLVYKKDLYLYGGYGPKNTYSTCIYCNLKMTLQWKEIRGVGVIPGGRANHSAILHENKMIVYGGHRNLEVFDELYIVNFETMRWEKVSYERGQGPGPVFSHVAVYVPPTQTMIIIGGFHQRQHNTYLAHSFDIRHRVWSGIRGPASVNPLHIQFCCAAYHSSTTSLIVIGLMEYDVLTTKEQDDMPSIYMMNVHSGAWVKVKTTVFPESPIAFHPGNVWEYFIREVISLGGIYDEERQEWYFPLYLEPIEALLGWKKLEKASVVTAYPKSRKSVKTSMYGVLKLQMQDISWSIVSVQFPRRVLLEISSGIQKAGTQGERRDSMGRRESIGRRDSMGRKKEKTALNKKQLPPVYSVSGVSRFQRKYAYAFIDFSGVRRQRSKQRVIVMHGGVGAENYPALFFVPILAKQCSASMTSMTSFPVGLESAATSLFRSPLISSSVETPALWWENKNEDSMSLGESEFSHMISETNPETASVNQTNVVADVNLVIGRPHRLNSDPSLLPLLPNSQNPKNAQRFAVLYHSRSAVHSEKVLPDANCPVAVMNGKADTKAWSENFYSETRQWIASALATEREASGTTRRSARKQFSPKAKSVDSDDDSLSTSSTVSKTVRDSKSAAGSASSRKMSLTAKPKDFFLDRNLEVFDLKDMEIRRASCNANSSFLLPGEEPESIVRLRVKTRRTREFQRLPPSVFQRSSLANVTDLGGAAAYQLMVASLANIDDVPGEAQRQRALIRWRYLRVMVLNGEASFIMHRVWEEEGERRAVEFSSTGLLVLAPDLQTRGTNSTKVSSRPIPFNLPVVPTHVVRSSQITPNGYVMYHPVAYVKKKQTVEY